MPEGPEVRALVDRVFMPLVGKTLTAWSGMVCPPLPSKLIMANCKGKWIYLKLRPVDTAFPPVFLVLHLGMTGGWSQDSSNYVRATATIGNTVLYFNDSRKLGKAQLLTTEQLREKLSTLGPDVLSRSFTQKKFAAQLTKRPWVASIRAIAATLIDDRFVCGIGNYLRAEILYYCRINPLVSTCDIAASPEMVSVLYSAVVTVVRASYAQQGTVPHGGSYKFCVYGRTVDPNGYNVCAHPMGGRTLYWVPDVQTLGA